MARQFEHQETARIRLEASGDERAPGAAITVALCGHWEHDGECRWPHHTGVECEDETLVVRTSFDAPAEEAEQVRGRIRAALVAGQLEGPDGRVTRWSLVEGGKP